MIIFAIILNKKDKAKLKSREYKIIFSLENIDSMIIIISKSVKNKNKNNQN